MKNLGFFYLEIRWSGPSGLFNILRKYLLLKDFDNLYKKEHLFVAKERLRSQ